MCTLQNEFEKAIREAYPNSPQYLNKNADGSYRNTTTFGAWIGWSLAHKAYSLPESCVVVPKEPEDSFIDDLADLICDEFDTTVLGSEHCAREVYKAVINQNGGES